MTRRRQAAMGVAMAACTLWFAGFVSGAELGVLTVLCATGVVLSAVLGRLS